MATDCTSCSKAALLDFEGSLLGNLVSLLNFTPISAVLVGSRCCRSFCEYAVCVCSVFYCSDFPAISFFFREILRFHSILLRIKDFGESHDCDYPSLHYIAMYCGVVYCIVVCCALV